MTRQWLLTCLATSAAGSTVDGATGASPENKAVENFESAAVPSGWNVAAGGGIEVTSERFKSGKKSLCWMWAEPGNSLVGMVPGGALSAAKDQCVVFWLYNEQPLDKILRLELLYRDRVIGDCWYVLNFRGWRPLAAPYGQLDLRSDKVDGMRLITPPGVEKGRLYLDYVNFQCRDAPRPDNQQPWIGRPEIRMPSAPAARRN